MPAPDGTGDGVAANYPVTRPDITLTRYSRPMTTRSVLRPVSAHPGDGPLALTIHGAVWKSHSVPLGNIAPNTGDARVVFGYGYQPRLNSELPNI